MEDAKKKRKPYKILPSKPLLQKVEAFLSMECSIAKICSYSSKQIFVN